MSCWQLEVALRKMTEAAHEATSATKNWRAELHARQAARITLAHIREKIENLAGFIHTTDAHGGFSRPPADPE